MVARSRPANGARKRQRLTYQLLNARRLELEHEWEECIDLLRSIRSGTSRDDDDSVETTNLDLFRRAEHLAREIRDLEAAVARLSAGRYGVCVDCGSRISATRLAARADAIRCTTCQEASERLTP